MVTPIDPVYQKAFYAVLDETVLCESLDDVIHDYTQVTIAGEVLDGNGCLTGGSSETRKEFKYETMSEV
jgi:chromosome segregation ATPase